MTMTTGINNSVTSVVATVIDLFVSALPTVFVFFAGMVSLYIAVRLVLAFMSSDNSYTIHGYYVKSTPYKGYNRFRSRKWNMNNTM